ncbi:MAG: phytanoyl-CoA dioxygenase family protein [Parvibaculum sp.]|uniref:phytanoyl-CoA dioxygenase family protein n=1 Tax=Parvibaculum sp. TaxID=2024848 RepID=UPI00284C3DCF|nr:phytanoyl-CoA dioxygenase family protein [Parvibaculum sp.]MDR3500890.1 phytanoyl-CoA dioxygenase family protein [Parvibaculum sp.]
MMKDDQSECRISDQVSAFRRDGAVILDRFLAADEIAPVNADCDAMFLARRNSHNAVVNTPKGAVGVFDPAQFRNTEHLPFAASKAMNLIGLNPRLIAFAKAALGVDDVRLYQCDAWAKFTGDADYDQPFHCDFKNHTLTVPGDTAAGSTINFMIFVTDVSDDLGAIHYVPNPEAAAIVGPMRTIMPEEADGGAGLGGAQISFDDNHATAFAHPKQLALKKIERSGAAPAGSVFAYSIDVYHRGTNLTRPGGHRYTITASFKAAGNDQVAWTAWPYHFLKPWNNVVDNASPEQLACLGIPRPGDPFWTANTIARMKQRWPNWDMTPYSAAL